MRVRAGRGHARAPCRHADEADVCRAVASHVGQPWALLARDVMSPAIVTCAPEDHLDTALVAMEEHRIRQVPVVDENRHVKGMILIEDAIRHTGTANGRLHAEAVMDVLRHICTPVADAEALT
jgi:CBS-domain-containing membrane protein